MLRISNLVAAALVALTASYGQAYEQSIDRTMTFRGGRVTIDHRFGSVEVRTTGGNQVTVHAVVHASDPDFGRQIEVITEALDGGVSIRTSYPEGHIHMRNGHFSYSVDLNVTIPERAPLSLKNRFGSVEVTGLRTASEIVNGQGSITFRDSSGAQRIENSFGSITIDNSRGNLSVQNANGSVHAQQVEGNLTVANRFASVSVLNVSRDVTIRNSNGSVELRSVGGSANITNSFASVNVTDVRGSLDLTNQNGRVEVRDIKGGAVIHNSFASTSFTNIGRDLTVTSQAPSASPEATTPSTSATSAVTPRSAARMAT
jgi:hypothetical protein